MRAITKVHIIPLGYEKDRITEPPIKYGANEVILLDHPDDTQHGSGAPNYHDEVKREFADAGMEPEIRECNIFDFYESFGTIAGIVSEYSDPDIVRVNLSTGSKITAAAGMVACVATDAEAYYAHAEEYNSPGEGGGKDAPLATGVSKTETLPFYPVDLPDEQSVRILHLIDARGPMMKKDLILECDAQGFAFCRSVDSSNLQAYYPPLDDILEPIKSRYGYIKLDSKNGGNQKLIQLTDEGRDALEAFDFMIK